MLPHLQKHIIDEVFFKDKSIVAIAEDLKISRQAVNNTKLRALKNLKKFLIENDYF
ncbi:sigma factor-like helix-turn-helix DNA-binding protein [Clostridium haemolyticum]|nr:sigma factor-like helix-turn-helix DNA-binding protein [Clostridium haemolyticum]